MKLKNFCIKHSVILILLFLSQAYSQSILKIEYYGVISSEIDENMYKMTSDLYYTQLSEISGFSITDKRTDKPLISPPVTELVSKDSLCFYAIIEKNTDGSKWISTLNVIDGKNNSKKSQSKEYDSYYKILMEPKSTLQDSIKQLISSNKYSLQTSSQADSSFPSDSNITSTEKLAGTWSGEEIIDKIVIMRGGRGFVILKNGASMNITINYQSDSQIIITQNGKANASYFPDLPRQVALKEAINASPIQWTFKLEGDSLKGTKRTLVAEGDSAKEGTVSTEWTRKQ